MECAKTFVEKHGKVESFIEDGTCSIVESKGRGGDFKRFSDCMIAPFEKVKKAEAEEKLCDGLKEISECETVHTACKNEYVGLAHGIANVSHLSHTVRNLHFLSKNSTLISRENCRFLGVKNS